jgi:transcription elongation factor Elf1
VSLKWRSKKVATQEKTIKELRMSKTIFLNRPCPHCGKHGKLYIDQDSFGYMEVCLSCGYSKDIDPPSASERENWGAKNK